MPPNSRLGPPRSTIEPAWIVRSATEDDARKLGHGLAKGCYEEIIATTKFQPISVLLKDYQNKAVIADERKPSKAVAMIEVTPITARKSAAVWVGLTEEIISSEWFFSFTDYAHKVLEVLTGDKPALLTYVDARNIRKILWLERVGFKLVEELPQYGHKELPFKLYKRTKARNV